MQKIIARIMAIMLLLSVFGQAAAQPCAEMHAPADMVHDMHDASGSAHLPMPADHCGDMPAAEVTNSGAHCTDASTSTGDDCGQTCTCCPSHCATVLPPSDTAGITVPSSIHHENYTDLASSAEPESAIKPPRSA